VCNVQVVADMLQQDVEEAGRAIAGRVREHDGDASVHAAATAHGGRSLEDRAHAALSSCPRFVLLDLKCVDISAPSSSLCAAAQSSRPGLQRLLSC
jgi:hypothetical protein